MILQWMVTGAACSAIVGIAALCVERAIAGRAAQRRVVWLAAILCSSVLPFAAPHEPIRTTHSAAVAASVSDVQSVSRPRASPSHTADFALLGAWAFSSLMFTLALIVAHVRTTRTLKHAARQILGGRGVFLTDDFGPAVVGILNPRVVIPQWALGLSPDEQTLIVAHESEHARLRDPLLAFVGLLAVVALPWNVVLWWQLARLRLAIEVDCDARVVRRVGGGSTAYAQMLLDASELARAMRNPVRHPALALAHSRSSLASRLDALLATTSPRLVHRSLALVLSAALIASVAFVPGPRGRVAFDGLSIARRDRSRDKAVVAMPSHVSRDSTFARPRQATNSRATQLLVPIVGPAPRSEAKPVDRGHDGARMHAVAALGSQAVPPARVIDESAIAGLSVHAATLPRRPALAGVIRARGVDAAMIPTARARSFNPADADTARGSGDVFIRRTVTPDSSVSGVSAGPIIRPRVDSVRQRTPNP